MKDSKNEVNDMTNRKYIVSFNCGTKYEKRFTRMVGSNKDEVYGDACAKYGFMNVACVCVDNEINVAWYKARGFKELQ